MDDQIVEDQMDVEEELIPMWPEDANVAGSQFNVDRPREDQDMLKEVAINAAEPQEIDLEHLNEMTSHSDKGSSQLASLVKHWEYKQANAVRLLREELDRLSKQREEFELKRLGILEEHRFEEERVGSDRHHSSELEELYDLYKVVPKKKQDSPVESEGLEINAEYDTIVYWKQRALILENLLNESRQREKALLEKLNESVNNMEKQSTPVEELSHMLKRADNFIHFILQNAPIVLGHMDKELRYRFIYNHYPSFKEEDIIGKTDTEIFSGAGMKESLDFKREVLERGLPGKREITFETELFGSKTFLNYVDPVFNKAGETIGVNYIGMDITDQVRKREKMAKLREEIAVQKAMETELNKAIHITEETMRTKQMLATISHEIRSPLSGFVSMAEVLSTTRLDQNQRQLLDVMISSGDFILQLVNDILDLSKVESGVMNSEVTKFRPREVVNNVLQTAAASLNKKLTLEGHIADDVPIQVVGDVLRIRQILTNLISNAIKFTHEGAVGIKLYLVPAPYSREEHIYVNTHTDTKEKGHSGKSYEDGNYDAQKNLHKPSTSVKGGETQSNDEDRRTVTSPATVWIRCDVYDTGIGIPEHALPTLFEKYMQASAEHTRKYGGTGLGLAICKQLVELMGGHMTVSSQENCGSTFTFILPYRVSHEADEESDPDDIRDASSDHDAASTDDNAAGYCLLQPRSLRSTMLTLGGSSRNHDLLQSNYGYTNILPDINPVSENFAATSKELEDVNLRFESSSRHIGDNKAVKISGTTYQNKVARDVGHLYKIQRSLDSDIVASRSGDQAQNMSSELQETLIMQTHYTSQQSTASSKPEANSASYEVAQNTSATLEKSLQILQHGSTMMLMNQSSSEYQKETIQRNVPLVKHIVQGPIDDGYSWRKYGQKHILGATYPRSYYRCTDRYTLGCLATKQVQRLDDDPSIFEVAYRGMHTCSQAPLQDEKVGEVQVTIPKSDASSSIHISTRMLSKQDLAARSTFTRASKQPATESETDIDLDTHSTCLEILEIPHDVDTEVYRSIEENTSGAPSLSGPTDNYSEEPELMSQDQEDELQVSETSQSTSLMGQTTGKTDVRATSSTDNDTFVHHEAVNRVPYQAETSEIEEVISALKVDVNMEVLSDAEAWALFCCQVGNVIEFPDINPYARAISEECHGSPVIISAMGSALRGESSVEEWKAALSNLQFKQYKGQDEVYFRRRHIRYCYNRLKARDVKNGFLYCSLFEQDKEIDISMLVECFMNEGLVGGANVAAYRRGHDIVRCLIDASLLEANHNGMMVRMHDIIRDSALEIILSNYQILVGLPVLEKDEDQSFQGSHWHGSCNFMTRAGAHLKDSPSVEEWERAAIISLMDNEVSTLPSKPNCFALVALFLQRNSSLRVIPASFFNSMSNLKLLNLSKTRIRSLPDSFSSLTSLQILLLCYCERMTSLPLSIGLLKSLEVLDLQGTEIIHLPDSVGALESLKQLRVSFYGTMNLREHKKLPAKLVSDGILLKLGLTELGMFVYPGDQRWTSSASSIIKEICYLKLSVLHFHFPKIEDLESFVHDSQSWINEDIIAFKFIVGPDFKRVVSLVSNDAQLLYNESQQCLRYVNGESIPSVVLEVLTRATSFHLDHHLKISYLSQFGIHCFKGLKICILSDCPEIVSLVDKYERGCFPCLEYLSINHLWNLKGIWGCHIGTGSFTRLRYLSIRACPKLSYVLTCNMVGMLSNLEELIIKDCVSLKYVIAKDDDAPSEGVGMTHEEVTTRERPTLCKLKVLKLHYLPEISGIWTTAQWPPLEYMSFYNCPGLRNLHMKGNEDVHIKEIAADMSWWDSLEWDDPLLSRKLDTVVTQIHVDDL